MLKLNKYEVEREYKKKEKKKKYSGKPWKLSVLILERILISKFSWTFPVLTFTTQVFRNNTLQYIWTYIFVKVELFDIFSWYS